MNSILAETVHPFNRHHRARFLLLDFCEKAREGGMKQWFLSLWVSKVAVLGTMTILSVLNSALSDFRDHKHWKRSTNAYQRITRVKYFLWFVVGLLGVRWSFMQLNPPVPKPHWRILANGFYIPETAGIYAVDIPVNNPTKS